MPNLIVPGGQKCGTSALAHFLSLHPDCFLSSPKEPSFFSRDQNLKDMAAYGRHFKGGERAKILFEASTGYLFESYVPERIRRTLLPKKPDLKCLIVLRRPVDRAISSYLHLKKRLDDRRHIVEVFDNPPTEAKALFADEERRIKDAMADGLIDVGRYRNRYDDWLWQFRYIRNSWYTDFVRAYCDMLGPDRLKIIFSEELRTMPDEITRDVFDFLGLSPFGHMDFSNPINPTLLPRGMDVFERTKSGPAGWFLQRYSNRILPRLGKAQVASAAEDKVLGKLKFDLDCILAKQYSELSDLANRDVAEIWPRLHNDG
jgi:hypothetical protein